MTYSFKTVSNHEGSYELIENDIHTLQIIYHTFNKLIDLNLSTAFTGGGELFKISGVPKGLDLARTHVSG